MMEKVRRQKKKKNKKKKKKINQVNPPPPIKSKVLDVSFRNFYFFKK